MKKLLLIVLLFVMVALVSQPPQVEAHEGDYELVAIESTKEYFDAQPAHMQQIFYGLAAPVEYPTWPEGTVMCIIDLNDNNFYAVIVSRPKE